MSVLAYSRRRILTVQPLCHSGRLLVFVCMAVLGYVVWVVCGVCGVCVVYSTNVFFRYVWMEMPEHERSRLQSEADPHRTATLVGCVMAVRKDYFIHIGAFDDGMNIWGGENIELGFRTWMCGGQVSVTFNRCTRGSTMLFDIYTNLTE